MPYREALMPLTLPADDSLLDDTLLVAIQDGLVVGRNEFSRGDEGTLRDREGVLRSVGGLRQGHHVMNPNTGLYERAVLTEGQRTNLLKYSEQFDNAVWTKSDTITITPDAFVAPDGQLTAERVQFSGTGRAHQFYASTGGVTYTYSLWVRAVSGSGTFVLGNNDGLSTTVEVSDAEWTRVTVTGAATSTKDIAWYIGADHRSISGSVTDFYAWGAQLEQAPFASSYVPTEGSSVSRADDNLSLDFRHAPQEMTVYCRFVENGASQINNSRIYELGTATSDWILTPYGNGSGGYGCNLWADGVNYSFPGVTGLNIGDVVEFVAQVIPDVSRGGEWAVNGVAQGASTTAGMSGRTTFDHSSLEPAIRIARTTSAASPGAFTDLRFERGAKTLDEMRARAGL